MKKQTLLLLLLICVSHGSIADTVNPQKAQSAAIQWMMAKAPGSSVAETHIISYDGETSCYVFNFEPDGFVIVSAEDAAIPVIGYSTSGRYSPQSSASAEAYLRFVSSQIHRTRQERIQADTRINIAWRTLLEPGQQPLEFNKLAAPPAVTAMLQSAWGQDAPYNIFCPDSACDRGAGSNSRTLAGCVATSMAMVMHHFNYPVSGSGSRNGITFSTQYDWINMPDLLTASSSQAQKDAVATLVRHAGAAVDMQYSCSYSGASLALARASLIQYFNYSSSVGYLFRSMGTTASWHSLLKSDIANGRPIIYGGLDSEGISGHAFILDGYDQGPDVTRYHINWGWNGYLNGFFAIDSLTPYPAADFNHHQTAILGIVPPAAQAHLSASISEWAAPNVGGISASILVSNSSAGDPTVIDYTITNNASWIQTSSSSGSTPGTFKISAAANPGGAPRAAIVTITSTTQNVTGSPITINVSQNGGSGSDPVMAVTPTTWTANITGGTSPAIQVTNATIGSTTVIDYDVASDVQWLTLSTNLGSTPGSFEIIASANGTGALRSGNITVSTNTSGVVNKTVVIPVSQAGSQQSSDTLNVTPTNWTASSLGGLSPTINVNVGSRSLPYSVSSNASWMTSSISNGNAPSAFTLTAEENSSGAIRTATVTITVNAAGILGSPFQLQVTQAASTNDPILAASMSSLTFSNQGGSSETISITNANPSSSESIEYFITENLSWLSVTNALGTTPGTLVITADENLIKEFRSGVVSIKAQDTSVLGSPWLITITQGDDVEPDPPVLSVNPRFWTAQGNGGESSEISITNSSASNTDPIPYTISDDASWLSLSSSIGSTPGEFTLNAEPNNSSGVRFAVVRVSSPSFNVEGSPQDIYVTQPPASGDVALLGVSPSSIVMANTGSISAPIKIYNASQTNSSTFDYRIEDVVPWISVSKFKGTVPDTLTIETGTNDSDTARVATISISTDDGSVFASPQVLTVYQTASLPGSSIGVSLSSWKTGPVSMQSPTIHVLGNGGARGIPYRIRSDVSWLSTSWTYGTTPGVFNILVSSNTKSEARVGRIFVADYQGGRAGTEHVITVNQMPFAGYPILDVSLESWDSPVSGGISPTIHVVNVNDDFEGSIQYIVSSDVPWLTASTINGSTPGEFILRTTANTDAASRSGSVSIRSITEGVINGIHSIQVRQGGFSSVLLSCSSSSSKSPDVDTRPGDRFDITVSLSEAISSSSSNDVDLSFLLHFDFAGLYPLDVSSAQGKSWFEVISPGIYRIHVKDRIIKSGAIAKIRFEALLGNSTVTSWSLSEPLVTPAISDLGLDLSCRGDVFLNPRNGYTTRSDLGIASLQDVFPNPAPAKSSPGLTVEVDEPGYMDIKIYNGMGTQSATLYTGFLSEGSHQLSINHKGLSPGVYIIVLRTAAGTRTKAFIITD